MALERVILTVLGLAAKTMTKYISFARPPKHRFQSTLIGIILTVFAHLPAKVTSTDMVTALVRNDSILVAFSILYCRIK